MAAGAASTMRRDIVSAYIAAGTRIASWAIVSAIVYRKLGAGAFGLLALVRGTIGLLNYAAVGLGPALIRVIAEESNKPQPVLPAEEENGIIPYHAPEMVRDPASGAYANGLVIAAVAGAIGLALTWAYAKWFGNAHPVVLGPVTLDGSSLVWAFGIATVLRILSDAPGAVLQARGYIATDNKLLALADMGWAVLTLFCVRASDRGSFGAVGLWFVFVNAALLGLRLYVVHNTLHLRVGDQINRAMLRCLLTAGSLIVLAQLADYLYAPTDYILIDRLLDPLSLAAYAPAVQIDGALLVLVAGLAAVLLPKSAVAHAAGDLAAVRKYYVRGTIASAGLLVTAGIGVWVLSPWVFRMWLGNDMVATQAILPLVLVHTVIGGSSAVGRSILLGMGKVRAFTIAVLIAGVSNVVFSFVFVKYLGWGLKGIVSGTIVAVVLRCGVWMPWYVMRAVRETTALEKGPGCASGAPIDLEQQIGS